MPKLGGVKGKKRLFHRLVSSSPGTRLQDQVGGAGEAESCWSEQLVAVRVCGQTLFADVTAIQKKRPETQNSGVAVRSEDFGRRQWQLICPP